MSNNKVIGIISYLPDDPFKRNQRKKQLEKLIYKCNYLFNLPIFIVAQNYSENDINEIRGFRNIILPYGYPKLGITGARRQLRQWFLKSNECRKFEWLIMLDDDCEIEGTSGTEYIKQIDALGNKGCFIEFNKTLLKLFAIHKCLLAWEDYDNINPENGEGFEDRIFVNKLRIKYPSLRREFSNTGLEEISISTRDENSTWYKDQNIKSMLSKTEKFINDIKNQNK